MEDNYKYVKRREVNSNSSDQGRSELDRASKVRRTSLEGESLEAIRKELGVDSEQRVDEGRISEMAQRVSTNLSRNSETREVYELKKQKKIIQTMDATIDSKNEYSINKIVHLKITDGDLLVFETDCQINGEFVYAIVVYKNNETEPTTRFGNLRQMIDMVNEYPILEILMDSKKLFSKEEKLLNKA